MSEIPYTHRVEITAEAAGLRLDKALASLLPELSRSRIQDLIAKGNVRRGNILMEDSAHKTLAGEHYSIAIPPPEPSYMQPVAIALDIVYEDADILVLNKQAGLTVHPGAGNHQDTLANALLYHCGGSLSGIGGVERPGIVHRLDKDTSGLMVVAKHDAAHRALAAAIAERTVTREYQALCWGVPQPVAGTITTQIGRSTRDRKKMAAKIQAMSMEAKASAAIIGALPPIVMIMVYIMSPGYISLLWTHPTGRLMMAGCLLWMTAGILVMKKMINFDF